uniref:Claudin n=1 Tax=Neolamprologus brichardi TaxID=32507 RepID=A0A3Q4G0T7_NEOBR
TTCALPSWKVTAFIGSNNITAELIFEGLWMYCVVQSTGQIKCKVHSSVLTLPQDLRTARALVVISIIIGFFAVLLGVIGNNANTIMNNFYKPFMKMELGTLLYIGWTSAGLLCLGGGILCSSCPPKGETKCEVTYSKAHSYGGPQEDCETD